MAFITADRVKDTSTTTGTGNITVSGSAPFGYRTFSTVLSVNDTFYYAIQGQSTAEWEIGVGTYASTNQFARTTVLASSASGSTVSFSSGTKNVFITLAAAKTLQLGPSDGPTAGSVPYGTGSTLAYSAVGTVGQVLTSNAAGAPTWNTVSGTGTVTSVNVSGGTTGLTTSGGPVTTSGTITMAGTLAVANGGTGLTTTPANGELDIGNGTGFTRTTLTAGSNITITNTAGGISIAASGAGTPNTISNGTSSVGIASSNGSVVAATNGTTALTINTSQNVGIGTSSPTQKLDVNGSINVANNMIVANGYGYNFAPTSAGLYITGNTTTNYMAFVTSSTERMRIDSSGNVGINSTSPSSFGKFVVAGPSALNVYVGAFVSDTAGDTAYPPLFVVKYDNNTTTSQVFQRFAINNNTATSGQINANGANAVAFGTWSDERLKENIVRLPPQLANICALRPVEFDYIKCGGHQVGFIAQEMREIFPDAVGVGDNDMLTISGWSKTEARLVSAIQELSAKNDALEARLAALEAK